jgi:hypothetical protein
LSSLTGQLGPNYDPLFYDVMIYIFGTMMFTVKQEEGSERKKDKKKNKMN